MLSSTAGFKAPGEAVLSPAEVISYDSKTSTKLLGVRRGIRGTIAQFHTKGSSIVYPGEIFDNITKDKAMELFNEDIKEIVNVVRKVVKVRLNQNQFDAIVSFVRNIGEIEFKKSFFLVELNKNNIVTHEFLRYSNINEIVEKSIDGVKKQVTVKVFQTGLYNRRVDEAVLFSQPESVENMEAV